MEIKSRQLYLLNSARESEDGKLIDGLLSELGITKRTFYYDLERTNEWLAFYKLGEIRVQKQRICLDVKNDEKFEKMLAETGGYYFYGEERQAMEMIVLTLSPWPVTIDKLRQQFDVSKNTVQTDIRVWKSRLEEWDLKIGSTVKDGYMLIGEEFSVRKLIGRQLQLLSNPRTRNSVKQLLQESLTCITGNEIDFFEISRCVIKQYERDIQGELFLDDIELECMLILVSWIRSMKGVRFETSEEEKRTLMKTASYRSLQLSLQKLALYQMEIPFDEVFYLIPLFLGIQTMDFVSREQEDSYIGRFAGELVHNFERAACISFADRDHLCSCLSFHVRPLYYRLKYGIETDNPLIGNIKSRYPQVYEFTKRALSETNHRIAGLISDDELGYLCVYFAGHLNQEKLAQSEGESRGRILIVGEANLAVTMLIEEQVKGLLGQHFIYEKITSGRFKNWMLSDYILIVSAVPLKKCGDNGKVVVVEPFLNDVNRKRIIEIIGEDGAASKYDRKIRQVMELAQEHCTGKILKDELYFSLFRLFFEEDRRRYGADVKSRLMERLSDRLEIQEAGTDWRRAVELACGRLTVGKYPCRRMAERLTNIMLKGRGKLYELKPQVLLICCPMRREADSRPDLTVLVTEERTVFPDGNGGRLLIFLTTVDNYSHWPYLKEIYQYFDREQNIRGILENNSREE